MFYFILLPLLFLLLGYKFLYSKTHGLNLPPSPPAIPFIGHLYLLKPPIHQLYQKFSQKYGPIFTLRFGSRRIVVITSSSLVQESFTGQNDLVLTNRPLNITAKHLGYNCTTIGTAPYGTHWRNLRKISTVEILSNHRLSNFAYIRKEEIMRMLTRLAPGSNYNINTKPDESGFTLVNLETLLSDLAFNNIVRMVTGKTYYGNEDEVSKEKQEEAFLYKKLVTDMATSAGASHPGDYLPILKLFGNKYEEGVKSIGKNMDMILQRLLDECKSDKEGNTMVNHLLSLQEEQPEYYTDITIKGLMMGMLNAGTDTTAVVMEWAMTNLLNHPTAFEKARSEIDDKIGQDRLIDEPDLAELPYLTSIINETFRLSPSSPLLIPRATSDNIKIGGYDVPKDTIVVVNAWAIHRDPKIWEDPEKFKPERFIGDNSGYIKESKLIPFGNGRRICPGAGLGQRIVTLAVGALIQCYDWEKVKGEEIDMSVNSGLTMRKTVPLRALCRPRPIMTKLLA